MSFSTLTPDDHVHFKEIYLLSKDQDKVKLREYLESSCFPFNIIVGRWTPISLLAVENDHKSVNFLLNEFNADIDDAVWGYAIGGHIHKVNELIAQGASRDWAVEGYHLGRIFCNDKMKLELIQSTLDLELQKMLIKEFVVNKSMRENLIKENSFKIEESSTRQSPYMKFSNFFFPKQSKELLCELEEKEKMDKLRIEINL